MDPIVKGQPRPSEWHRAKWVFGTLWIALTVLLALNALLVRPPTPDYPILAVNIAIAIVIATFVARDIWQLRARRSPLWVDIVICVLVIGGLVALIVARETRIWAWNKLHLDIPVLVLLGVLALASFATESRKRVRVYIGTRQLHFVDENTGL